MSLEQLQLVREYLEDHLRRDVIAHSDVSYASPVLFIKKPGRGWRFCVDYRKLNAILEVGAKCPDCGGMVKAGHLDADYRKFDMYEIGRVARRGEEDGGLACRDAMLFDGGHSTQIYIDGEDEHVEVHGDPVPVFIYATKR